MDKFTELVSKYDPILCVETAEVVSSAEVHGNGGIETNEEIESSEVRSDGDVHVVDELVSPEEEACVEGGTDDGGIETSEVHSDDTVADKVDSSMECRDGKVDAPAKLGVDNEQVDHEAEEDIQRRIAKREVMK